MGMVKMEFPTVTFIPSTMARVRGIFMVIVVPAPSSLEMETVPPTDSTFFLTTSMPTPRPEYSVTAWLVEKPGTIIRLKASFRVYSLSGLVSSPFSLALAKSLWGSMPYPSSDTEMTTSLLVWEADRMISPWGSLPAAIRSSFVSSMPWSMLLRTICMMGSWILSTMVLSTSVSSPMILRRTSLPSFWFMSRTIRFIFWNTPDMGTMRRDMAISCRSSVSLRSCRPDFMKLSKLSLGRSFSSGEEVTMDSVMTISPTISIRLSSFIRFTLIRFCFTGA